MFLGVILDGNLSWKPTIANIAVKVSNSISVICKSSLCLPSSTLCTLYCSLVYPHLLYCITVWGSNYPSTLKRIVLLQKKVVRIISRSAFNAHTEPIFKQLKILNLCKKTPPIITSASFSREIKNPIMLPFLIK